MDGNCTERKTFSTRGCASPPRFVVRIFSHFNRFCSLPPFHASPLEVTLQVLCLCRTVLCQQQYLRAGDTSVFSRVPRGNVFFKVHSTSCLLAVTFCLVLLPTILSPPLLLVESSEDAEVHDLLLLQCFDLLFLELFNSSVMTRTPCPLFTLSLQLVRQVPLLSFTSDPISQGTSFRLSREADCFASFGPIKHRKLLPPRMTNLNLTLSWLSSKLPSPFSPLI